ALVASLAGALSGCSVVDACAGLCAFGPDIAKSKLGPAPAIDRSTTHCDQLAGQTWVAENGDQLAFAASFVDWRHGGIAERRGWRCEVNRQVLLEGFASTWQGTFAFQKDGTATLWLQPF